MHIVKIYIGIVVLTILIFESINELFYDNLLFQNTFGNQLSFHRINELFESYKKSQWLGYATIGSGKSTIINILQRFHEFESGTIKINGSDWSEITTPDWRSLTGYVSQNVELFRTSVLANINLEEDTDAEKIVSFCKDNGLHKYITAFPQGYFTVVNENGSNLSGGQKQLVGIARALYKKPQLLLLDEATSAMDLRTEKFVFDLLERFKKDMSIVFVTHKPNLAKIADRIYILEENTLSPVHLTNETCSVT
jgi:ATP-binding cassette, subfamily C, bacteriocin exporter